MLRKIKDSYEGKWVPFESASIIGGCNRRHWTAEIARKLVLFYLNNWEWCWVMILAFASLFVAIIDL